LIRQTKKTNMEIFQMEFEDEDRRDYVEERKPSPPPSQSISFQNNSNGKTGKQGKRRVRFQEEKENSEGIEERDVHEKNSLSNHKTSPGGTVNTSKPNMQEIQAEETYGFSVQDSPSVYIPQTHSNIKRESNYMRSKFRYFNKLNIGRPPVANPINSAPQSNPIPIQLENNHNSDFDSDFNNTLAQTFIPPHELVNRSAFSVWDKQRKKIPKKKDF